jgi:ketosteroid isomerase-like protein
MTAAAMPSSPPADTTPAPPPKPSLAEVIPATLKGIGEAFNAHDAKKLATYYTEDSVASAYGYPDAHGRDEIAKTLQGFFDTFGDVKSAPTRAWSRGNVVVSEVVWAGTMTGDFMGTKASKKPAGAIRAHVMWFNDDGLVKEMHEYGDDAGVMAQMTGKKGAPPVPVLPTNAPEMHIAKGTADEDKLGDWGKGMDDAFNKDDTKAALAFLADDADYWLSVSGMPATKGKKDLTKDLDAWFKAFPDQKWTSTNVWGIDGFGILEHTMTGTQKGRLGPLPASNKQVTNWHWLDIVQPTADGKVQHGWGYANLFEMMQQTGALKPPGEKSAAAAGKAPTAKPAAPKAP